MKLPLMLPWLGDPTFNRHAAALAPAAMSSSTASRLAFMQQDELDKPFQPAMQHEWFEVPRKVALDLAAHRRESDDAEDWLQVSAEDLDAELNARQAEFEAHDRRRGTHRRAGEAATGPGGNAAAGGAGAGSATTAAPEQLHAELAALGGAVSALVERASSLDGVDAAPVPRRAAAGGGSQDGDDGDDSESSSASAPEGDFDVMGEEDDLESSSDDGVMDGDGGGGGATAAIGRTTASGGTMHNYFAELDEQLSGALDGDGDGDGDDGNAGSGGGAERPHRAGQDHDGLPLLSHHVKVHGGAEPLDLDVHAMEHILASYCSEQHLAPGPASLLLGELGAAGRGAAVPLELDTMD
eukprot:NODE_9547_length_1416_cov_2.579519.p1 GENE.NODE_9547_length_1416_cov_2.579519~~NODE_9547_length_1416_cov_2.579519.p1  ORF type:complete len:354 (-),score=150.14 NODE_9547_length_1416_cov_2.579519:150-1211(-)